MLPRSLQHKLLRASIQTSKRQGVWQRARATRRIDAIQHGAVTSRTSTGSPSGIAHPLHTSSSPSYPRWINKKSDNGKEVEQEEQLVEGEQQRGRGAAAALSSSSSDPRATEDSSSPSSTATQPTSSESPSQQQQHSDPQASASTSNGSSSSSSSSSTGVTAHPSPPSEASQTSGGSGSQIRRQTRSLKSNQSPGEGSSGSASSSSSSSSSGNAAGGSGSGSSGSGGGSSSSSGHSSATHTTTSISKPTVPEVYPQVLALPITRRPLFPGFYKAVVVRDPAVVAAIKEMMKRGQPYLGAFLLKDAEADSDIITDVDSIHKVGVFAQITSVFPAQGGSKDEPEGLTAVLYPHRRIKITELLPPRDAATPIHSIIKTAEEDGVLPPSPTTSTTAPPRPPASPATSEASQATSSSTDGASSVSVPSDAESDSSSPAATTVSSTSATSTSGPEVSPAAASPSASPSPMSTQPFQTSFLQDFAVSLVNVENVSLEGYKKNSSVVKAVTSEIISVFKDIATLSPLFRDQIANFSLQSGAGNVFDEPEKLADFAAAVSNGEIEELQSVLTSTTIEDRLQKALFVLKKELMNAQLQNKISREVEGKIQKRQREYYLMEQLKGIKKELGLESDGKDKMVEKFKEKAEALNMPEQVKKVFDEEISKLQHLEPAASEFNVTRNYLDWLTQIPWGRHSEENFSIPNAVTVLDEDHYGLKDVKDRILEFLAVGKLRGTVEGKILCFVGPPGVGKTSIGKSIARALNRQFFRFSVGGLTDVAEIKGHRRTYVGAMPGKIIQALKKVQTENPLILIDEVDKIGRGINGDPASALLEMLDPEQNVAFLDHYCDVPVDLSRVLFVCTANTLDTIPAPLLDRMEVMEVSGYVSEEKVAIASKYLAPQAKDGAGLKNADVELTKDAVDTLIRYYARESGVRRLKQHIEKIYRKAALKIVKDLGEEKLPESQATTEPPANDNSKVTEEAVPKEDGQPSHASSTATLDGSSTATSPGDAKAATSDVRNTTTEVRKPLEVPSDVHVVINAENLADYVGPPKYQKERIYTKMGPPGVASGLGYTGDGAGSVMPIESSVMPGSGILLTGKLGEVIKESAQIALSFIKTHAYTLKLTKEPDQDILDKKAIHLHMPEGAIGKDGPSAGSALLSSMISLFSGTQIPSDIALTGEITLAGQVLPVGGLKEKLLAAHRSGVRKVIVPAGVKSDIDYNVPPSIKDKLEIVYVENVAQVLAEVFKGSEIATLAAKLPMAEQTEVASPASD